ncbi:MAG: 16S rRNA (guanine(966)-N(2))-methyltransferase RsmD [Deltaproteobacteria bacterium]|nr:16S rRNA (guanine(966)-N(2))-methyltransferase RsmD [Deltaproteobacteria bacterium]
MRIIGGEAGGRPLHLPKGCRIRPTSDRVKESLFAILRDVSGCRFLDLFAGSGNVGLEALSRGARDAVFVEKAPLLAAAIKDNLQRLGYQGRAEIIAADAVSGLRRLAKRGERFEILFADPPYEEGLLEELGAGLQEADLLAEEGLVVLQHSVHETWEPSQWPPLTLADQRRYGDTLLTFLEKRKEK